MGVLTLAKSSGVVLLTILTRGPRDARPGAFFFSANLRDAVALTEGGAKFGEGRRNVLQFNAGQFPQTVS
jgi:hypothetical protein